MWNGSGRRVDVDDDDGGAGRVMRGGEGVMGLCVVRFNECVERVRHGWGGGARRGKGKRFGVG